MGHSPQGGFSHTAHHIAVVTVAIGLAAAIISFLIMRGFQDTVEDKIYRFTGHLLVSKFTVNNAVEAPPFSFNTALYNDLKNKKYPCVEHVEACAYKSGLIRTENDALGVVFKGVGKNFDVAHFNENLVSGHFLNLPDSGYAKTVVISQAIADKIGAQTDDDIVLHFFQNPPRFRKLRVVGIYETNLSDYFDDKMIIGDLRLIQRLNGWADSVASSLEIYLHDSACVEEAYTAIGEHMDYDLYIEKTQEKYAEIFEWLGLISRQVRILLGVIFIVVCVNMISIVLILVMERTQMIGLLKAVGASNQLIRTVFLYSGLHFIAKGLLYGNVLGLGLCFIQDVFKIITLNPHDYYMNVVPITWDWAAILVLNLLVLAVTSFALFLPAAIAARTEPIKAIRFD